ncbi:aminoalkylphosphonic acid N-acetyltransferase [Nocardioides dokdonensis FR1436]|uniref:Aminoalkylphosphonic acid N-acetyltransferase n=1 Tax=Nocardioides dokdonensis FR1436 TaxID=1300347 RepID=A0A1A9GM22_9ACTN|nr:GNAT family N-acetyltransferase [Nocardioides dokdonensis]ANH39324.1 aminoalkylphosphonic acid N-acetyltransferase [Nocardioides dokdonensis FR1436]
MGIADDASRLGTLDVAGTAYAVTRARRGDVGALVALLADDELGRQRETADPEPYLRAFARIDRSPDHLLVAVRAPEGTVVGTLHLVMLPDLSRGATLRLQVEAVRVATSVRDLGLGTALLEWVTGYARSHGAGLVQLTTDRAREDARRFYERLGYVPSHDGMKLHLG